ncbi:Protein ROOT PRIMORDIUM DEFECTIVE 1, partial [Mucuna pruriens]
MLRRRIDIDVEGRVKWVFLRSLSMWSMKKEAELESALSRNRRWVVNNQIKNIILRYPNNEIPIATLQKKFKTLDLQGKALNWLSKYPCCFEIHDHRCRLTKRMMNLVSQEQSLLHSLEPLFVRRLAKLLMLSLHKRLTLLKINEFKRSFGFPDDYLIRIVPSYPNLFRIVNESGRRSSMAVELLHWDPHLAVSSVEASALKLGSPPRFSCSLPSTWLKSWERFREFDEIPYFSPYSDVSSLVEGSKEMEKRNVGLVHELLSLTLWKKASIVKLSHFRREFVLPDRLNVLLLKHPGIFYVSNKYQIYTVLLREAYVGSQLVDKDPLVVIKDKFGELMQEGLHEYNQRRRLLNLDKRKNNGVPFISADAAAKGRRRRREASSDDDDGDGKFGDVRVRLVGAKSKLKTFPVPVPILNTN